MDPRSFALRLRLHKMEDAGVHGVLLLHELLLKQGHKNLEMVQGFLTVAGETCWHVWLKDEKDEIIDLGRILAELKDPEFKKCVFKYSLEEPDGYTRDKEDVNQKIWEARESKDFWKTVPKKFQTFRSKCHSLVHV